MEGSRFGARAPATTGPSPRGLADLPLRARWPLPVPIRVRPTRRSGPACSFAIRRSLLPAATALKGPNNVVISSEAQSRKVAWRSVGQQWKSCSRILAAYHLLSGKALAGSSHSFRRYGGASAIEKVGDPMFRTVVVPLDGSPFAEQALPHALGIVRRAGVPSTWSTSMSSKSRRNTRSLVIRMIPVSTRNISARSSFIWNARRNRWRPCRRCRGLRP